MAVPGTSWEAGAEFGAPEVWVEAGELAAYRLARMSARLVQGLAGGGADPEQVWHTLAASCPIDFAISRTLTALGRTGPLRGYAIDVRAIRKIQAFAPVEAPCSLCAEARVLSHVVAAEDAAVLQLAVLLTRNPDGARVASFELELRLVRRAAA
jgi:hypothetical protein